jgi:hypothetical protein
VRGDLLDIRDGIQAGKFANEAAVSQGVVQRMLHLLGWPVYDTSVVSPEHSLGGRRVDYALCHPSHKPLVLIEVKQVGQSEGADRQLFEYAFHGGVPMAILTDGREWSFFLPTEQGRYDERRLYKLDVLERNPEEIEAALRRYLEYEGMCSGRAMENARSDYRDAARKREAQKALPEAWAKLVASFLRGHSHIGESDRPYKEAPRKRRPPPEPRSGDGPDFVGFSLDGRTRRCKNAVETYVGVFEELSRRDPDFPARFADRPKGRSKRPYMSRTREGLYPGNPGFEGGRKLRGGWWLDTNLSNDQKMRLIRIACEVAGIKYGADL